MRLLILAMVGVLCSQAVAADYLGRVLAVSDGDTFGNRQGHVRICGLGAPERGQPGCGQAAGVPSNMIQVKTLHCLLRQR
jgi:endonuclease YncB( thermonuclease family)